MMVALLKRAPDWPVELHEAADEYERAMDKMDGMAARDYRQLPKDAVALLVAIQKARDHFVRLRQLHREGKLI
jgi:hypothetical protein